MMVGGVRKKRMPWGRRERGEGEGGGGGGGEVGGRGGKGIGRVEGGG